VYDESVQGQRFERELALIETRLTDLGISGKIARLALFRDAEELIRDEVRRGTKTVVAVGNDQTLRKVMDAVADPAIVIAIIPLGPGNNIADILGIPQGVAACDVLSARLVEELDLGSVNGMRFLHMVTATGVAPVCTCEGSFSITPVCKSTIEIRNLVQSDDLGAADPTDGKLEFVMRTPRRSWLIKTVDALTKLPFTHLQLKSADTMSLLVDGEQLQGTEFDIKILPKQIRIVTGKDRKYV
jgi:diacylglycerol kinase family enzyme